MTAPRTGPLADVKPGDALTIHAHERGAWAPIGTATCTRRTATRIITGERRWDLHGAERFDGVRIPWGQPSAILRRARPGDTEEVARAPLRRAMVAAVETRDKARRIAENRRRDLESAERAVADLGANAAEMTRLYVEAGGKVEP